MTRIGSFEDLMADTVPAMQPVAERLRATIRSVHPDAVEVVRLGDRAATYGIGPRKMKDGYTYILPHRKWVNLGFFQGAALPDPEELLEGIGAQMRHVKIRGLSAADTPALRALLAAALAERQGAGEIVEDDE